MKKKICFSVFIMFLIIVALSSVSYASTNEQLSWERNWLQRENYFLTAKKASLDSTDDALIYFTKTYLGSVVETTYTEYIEQNIIVEMFLHCNRKDVAVIDITKYLSIEEKYRPTAGKVYDCMKDFSSRSQIDFSTLSNRIQYAFLMNPTLSFLKFRIDVYNKDYRALEAVYNDKDGNQHVLNFGTGYEDYFVNHALWLEKQSKYYEAVDVYGRLIKYISEEHNSFDFQIAYLLINMDQGRRDAFQLVYYCAQTMTDDPDYEKDRNDDKKNRFEKIEELTKAAEPGYKGNGRKIPCVKEAMDQQHIQGSIIRYKLLRIGIRDSLIRKISERSNVNSELLMKNLRYYSDYIDNISKLEDKYKPPFTPDSVVFSTIPALDQMIILNQHSIYIAETKFAKISFAGFNANSATGWAKCGWGFVSGFASIHGAGMLAFGMAVGVLVGPIGTVTFAAAGLAFSYLNAAQLASDYEYLDDIERTEKICGSTLDAFFSVFDAVDVAHAVSKINLKKVKQTSLPDDLGKVDSGNLNSFSDLDNLPTTSTERPLTPVEKANMIDGAIAKVNDVAQTPIEKLTEKLPQNVKDKAVKTLEDIGFGCLTK